MNPVDFYTFKKLYGGNYPTMKIAYDANNQAEYIGFSERGAATSAALWVIFNLTYDANGNMTDAKTAPTNSIWDDRAGLTYA